MHVRNHVAQPAPASTHAQQQPRARRRGTGARVAMIGSFGLLGVRRGLSWGRLAFAAPRAWREHKMPLWAFQMLTGKTTVDVVPFQGGRWNLWGKAFAAAQAMRGAGALVAIGTSTANLVDAFAHEGPSGIYASRSGRTGVVTAALSVPVVTMMGRTYLDAPSNNPAKALKHTLTQRHLGTYKLVGWLLASAAFVGANELGYLDFLNKGDGRSIAQVAKDRTAFLGAGLRDAAAGAARTIDRAL